MAGDYVGMISEQGELVFMQDSTPATAAAGTI